MIVAASVDSFLHDSVVDSIREDPSCTHIILVTVLQHSDILMLFTPLLILVPILNLDCKVRAESHVPDDRSTAVPDDSRGNGTQPTCLGIQFGRFDERDYTTYLAKGVLQVIVTVFNSALQV